MALVKVATKSSHVEISHETEKLDAGDVTASFWNADRVTIA
ncbi:hypothetical protein [Sphingomonas sp. VL_57B]|jgi:hypothetical protein